VLARGAFHSVDWSPDGATLVAALGNRLVKLPATGGALTDLGVKGKDPAWSPDGKTIAYSDVGIWLVRPDGSGAHEITFTHEAAGDIANEDAQPAWSPDGSTLAYASGTSLLNAVTTEVRGPDAVEPEAYTLWSVPAAGGSPSLIFTPSGPADFDPTWVR
jgi:dipeptidyl aminopeptidase/acylaminoacyl peptidase